MRIFLALAMCAPLLAACESMTNKIDQSRKDRCEIADWAKVGERDGFDGYVNMIDRYSHVCGELFKLGPYQEGFQKGVARKPPPRA
jgi:hypothetical protein